MEFRHLTGSKDKRGFLRFYYGVYEGDSAFVDTDVFILKDMLFQKTQVARDMTILPVAVFESGAKACQCILFASNKEDSLFLGYFDALKGKDAEVAFLLENAKSIAREQKKSRLVVGINGHISCGVGLLQDNFDKKASFDSRYCKSYYKDYFCGLERHGLTTYVQSVASFSKSAAMLRASGGFGYRFFEPNNFESEMEIFSLLCNQTLCGTNFYYEMKPYHMKDLLVGMRPFLKRENLIFAMDGDREVGFLFWHPDYNELFLAGKRNGLLAVFFRFLTKKIKNCKINAVGILDEYRNTEALLTLMTVFLQSAAQFERVETTFVWDSNKNSFRLASKKMDEYKHYCVYEAETE